MFFVAGDYKKCLRSSKIVRPATDFRTESTFASQVSETTRTCDRKGGDLRHLAPKGLSFFYRGWPKRAQNKKPHNQSTKCFVILLCHNTFAKSYDSKVGLITQKRCILVTVFAALLLPILFYACYYLCCSLVTDFVVFFVTGYKREDEYTNFSFRMNRETGLLSECTPTVNHTGESLKMRRAEERVREVLHSGEMIRHNELKRRIMGPDGSYVSEGTAKEYISVLLGTVLTKNSDGCYCLADPEMELPLDEDMPAG